MSNTTISGAVDSALKHHVDDDTCQYIASLLEDDPLDPDARQAVTALVEGSVEENDVVDAMQVCQSLFALLDLGTSGEQAVASSTGISSPSLRKLDVAVTLKEHDVQTFASGLATEQHNNSAEPEQKESKIAAFYANMIDISSSQAALSERARRKARQKELREQLEEEERQRAINEAMNMLEATDQTVSKNNTAAEQAMDHAVQDNAADVHFTNFDLPNLRGGGPNLLTDASVTLSKGRRYGLLGYNGCGKTTFLSFVAGRHVPNAVPTHMSMLLVRQEIMGNEWTAVETVLKSDVKRESVKRFIGWCEEELSRLENNNNSVVPVEHGESSAKQPSDTKAVSKGRVKLRDRKRNKLKQAARDKVVQSVAPAIVKESMEQRRTRLNEKLAMAYQQMGLIEELEGGDPEPRARKVLAGLGFTTAMQDKPTKELSGGWRMRVSLSCALFASPSLLLLDEPTNHLDLEAVLWLEKYLTTKFTGTVLVVSHDRHFLNEVVTDVIHFHRNKLTTYRGDISSFEAVRADDKLRQIRLREVQEKKREHLQKYIDLHAQAGENGVKAARQRKSKMKKLDKLGVMAQDGKKWKSSYDGDADEVEEFVEDATIELHFPDPGSFKGEIVRLEQVDFGYTPDSLLLRGVDLSINMSSCACLLGRNGAGKSTVVKLAVGALQPSKGKVVIDGSAKIEYLAQHQLEQLDPDGTPLQTMIDRYPGDRSNTHVGELRRYLANFGLGGEVLPLQKIHTMSGGQKCRLCLASAMYRKPHLLILDEPTNHLDLETTEALIDAIKTFQGGVLLVSHDQHLLTSVCSDMYVVEKGKVERLGGGTSSGEDFEAYKRAVVAGRR